MKINFQRFLIPLFIFVWWNRLHYYYPFSDTNKKYLVKVVKVKGWRTVLIDSLSQRETITFMFKWETKLEDLKFKFKWGK